MKNYLIKKKDKNGFTLLELILYMALVAMMMSYLTPMAWNMILGSKKVVTQQELSTQARFVAERIKYEIRNARDITAVTSNSITLIASDSSRNPVIIDRDATTKKIRIKLGAAPYVNLNSADTDVESLTFSNYSSVATTKSKHVGFRFTMDTNYDSQRKEYYQSTTIESSAEVRSN